MALPLKKKARTLKLIVGRIFVGCMCIDIVEQISPLKIVLHKITDESTPYRKYLLGP